MADEMRVQVAFALPGEQAVVDLVVPAGTRVREALQRSRLPERYPQIDVHGCPLGVFGRVVGDDYVLQPGDRLEVYRPLAQDPRDARRKAVVRKVARGTH